MRKGQRFTPTKIRNWMDSGRGTGTFADYQPWHQITRGDPASRGRSQLALWARTDRSHHYLSDTESDVFGFVTMLPQAIDVCEQFPLNLHEHQIELAAYSATHTNICSAGTLAIAEEMKIKHPLVKTHSDKESWVMTTDIVVALQFEVGHYELLAVSVKPNNNLTKRQRRLLQLEKEYWNRQGVEWLLITPDLYEKSVGLTIRMSLPWGLPKKNCDIVEINYLDACAAKATSFNGKSLTECLQLLRSQLGVSMDLAQRAFWQTVWKNRLKIDLCRSPWPSTPIRLLNDVQFLAQNPVASRRSICL